MGKQTAQAKEVYLGDIYSILGRSSGGARDQASGTWGQGPGTIPGTRDQGPPFQHFRITLWIYTVGVSYGEGWVGALLAVVKSCSIGQDNLHLQTESMTVHLEEKNRLVIKAAWLNSGGNLCQASITSREESLHASETELSRVKNAPSVFQDPYNWKGFPQHFVGREDCERNNF